MPETPAASSFVHGLARMAENGALNVNQSSFVAREAVMAVVSDDHNAQAGEVALCEIIAGVRQAGGTDGLADLAIELALKLAETVERIAEDRGLAAVDVLDILFVDSVDVMSLLPGTGHLLGSPIQGQIRYGDPQDRP